MSNISIPPREYAEWANFWFEKGSDFLTPRVMLIGDSITNGYKPEVKKHLDKLCIYTDMAISSRCAGDPALYAELTYALGDANGYSYKVIHFNNGLHGGCNDTKIPLLAYDDGMRRAIELIKKLQDKAKLIIATCTPIRGNNPSGYIDEKLNDFVLERNELIRGLAKEYGLVLNDLFEVMAGRSEYTQSDGIHYDEEGRIALGKAVSSVIESQLN